MLQNPSPHEHARAAPDAGREMEVCRGLSLGWCVEMCKKGEETEGNGCACMCVYVCMRRCGSVRLYVSVPLLHVSRTVSLSSPSPCPTYQVLDGQLTWLVYMVGAVIGGHAASELHGSTDGVSGSYMGV